jgi:hypothetical protein
MYGIQSSVMKFQARNLPDRILVCPSLPMTISLPNEMIS